MPELGTDKSLVKSQGPQDQVEIQGLGGGVK